MKQPSIVPLNKEQHRGLKVKQDGSFAVAENQHLVALTMRECPSAASSMPIIFIKNPQSQEFHLAAVLGVEPQSSLYQQDGKWLSHHVPWNIQRHPFDIKGTVEQLNVFIDENSPLIDDAGIAVFDDEGNGTQYFDHMQRLLGAIAESELTGKDFIKILTDNDILEPIQINVTYASGELKSLVGMYGINESKVNKLSDETILSMMKNGSLGIIYSVLTSLGQLNRLIDLSRTSAKPLQSLQVVPDANAKQENSKAESEEKEPKEAKPKTKKATTKKTTSK
jgi:hypothetical protein